jgi:phosphotransferase system HPr-like phosphotransfer protein
MQSVVFKSQTCSKEEKIHASQTQDKTLAHVCCKILVIAYILYTFTVTDLDCTIAGCSNNTTPIVGESCIVHIRCMATKLFQHLSRFEAMNSILHKEPLHSAVAKHLVKLLRLKHKFKATLKLCCT